MDIEKMCRCCLTNEGPLLTIYAEDGGATNNNKNTLADMIREITKIKVSTHKQFLKILTIKLNASYGFYFH